MKLFRKIAGVSTCAALAIALSGCGVFMPYKDDFTCQKGKGKGVCGSITDIYELSDDPDELHYWVYEAEAKDKKDGAYKVSKRFRAKVNPTWLERQNEQLLAMVEAVSIQDIRNKQPAIFRYYVDHRIANILRQAGDEVSAAELNRRLRLAMNGDYENEDNLDFLKDTTTSFGIEWGDNTGGGYNKSSGNPNGKSLLDKLALAIQSGKLNPHLLGEDADSLVQQLAEVLSNNEKAREAFLAAYDGAYGVHGITDDLDNLEATNSFVRDTLGFAPKDERFDNANVETNAETNKNKSLLETLLADNDSDKGNKPKNSNKDSDDFNGEIDYETCSGNVITRIDDKVKVGVHSAYVRAEPSIKAKIVRVEKKGKLLEAEYEQKCWVKLSDGNFIHRSIVLTRGE